MLNLGWIRMLRSGCFIDPDNRYVQSCKLVMNKLIQKRSDTGLLPKLDLYFRKIGLRFIKFQNEPVPALEAFTGVSYFPVRNG